MLRRMHTRSPAGRRDAWRVFGIPARSFIHVSLPATLAGALLVAGGCAKSRTGAGFQMPPVPVEVSTVAPQTVRDRFRALGSLEATENISVVSELNAVVRELPFVEGSAVQQGDLLAQLDDDEIRASAERAEAQRELAQANAERARTLAAGDVISKKDLDDAQTALKVAQADEALAKARLAKTQIRAPFSGLVGRRRVSPGAYLKAGDVITELARVDQMKVAFAAPERYLPQIKRGGDVEVETPAFPGRTFTGTVTVVDPIVDPETRTVQLVARVRNSDLVLRPGMSADVNVTLGVRTKALVVPDEAVFAQGNETFVYVVNADSTVTRKSIVLGTRDSSRVEVVRGLDPGAVVVRTGHHKLFEGAHVMPVPSMAGAAATTAAKPAVAGGDEE